MAVAALGAGRSAMTPTLFGRIQTRFLLLFSVGFIITLLWAIFAYLWTGQLLGFLSPLIILIFVALAGIGWDILYTFAQRFRWDRDWPPFLQWVAGFLEMWPAWVLGFLLGVPWWLFLLHYWTVFTAVYIMTQGPMRILFPRWRFRGGQWL
jgi:hypothetical protein